MTLAWPNVYSMSFRNKQMKKRAPQIHFQKQLLIAFFIGFFSCKWEEN